MDKNDWTSKLRERLTDYQEPVNHDLWANIEQSLDMKPKKETTTIHLRRFSMAAALAALIIGGTYMVFIPYEQDVTTIAGMKRPTGETSCDKAKTMMDNNGELVAVASGSKRPIAQMRGVSGHDARKNSPLKECPDGIQGCWEGMADPTMVLESPSEANESFPKTKGNDSETKSCTSETKENSSPFSASQATEVPSGKSKQPENSAGIPLTSHEAMEYSTSSRKICSRKGNAWNVKVYGENGFIGNGSTSGSVSYPMLSSAPAAFDGSANSTEVMEKNSFVLAVATKKTAKHHLPISVGLQMGFCLAPRLTLSTGVVYTQVNSYFYEEDGGGQSVSSQSLHYVGVPLTLNYDIWGTQRLHTYLSAGGEGDVNVKNKTERCGMDVETEKDRMQWSTQAALGVQYDILPQLGIYVEPGAKYYFDNGSSVENTFKDKKLNFNLQLGLRWNIGK